jgi:hypothetical protein
LRGTAKETISLFKPTQLGTLALALRAVIGRPGPIERSVASDAEIRGTVESGAIRMSSFDVWLNTQPAGQSGLSELLQARSDLGVAWPAGGEGWSAYAVAIAQSPVIADKGKVLASLEAVFRRYRPETAAKSFWATIAGWVSNVYFWAVLLGGATIFALFSFALDKSMLAELAKPEQARGLVTFLFAVATVGIALVIVLAVLLSTGTKEDLAERFRMGKDILAVLIGVFGTIVGFYFGSELARTAPAATEASRPPTN